MRPQGVKRRAMIASGALAIALATGIGLSGCAGDPYDAKTAEALQAQVLAVTQASAAGDWTTATAKLDALTADAADARADGRIDDKRYDSISAAIALVGSDLAANVRAAQEQAAEQQRIADEQAAQAAQAALEQQQQEQAPAPAPAPKPDDKGGPGKDKGPKDDKDKPGKG
ncbi:hypothetical protein WDJ51_07630 [Rathayibacter sp. YIM 133350]|uniref:hypothetical protein n=1 Tax=Rathayibacter sp. YIM 133350 TaxID=3131992 RepID=UPI00307CD5B4